MLLLLVGETTTYYERARSEAYWNRNFAFARVSAMPARSRKSDAPKLQPASSVRFALRFESHRLRPVDCCAEIFTYLDRTREAAMRLARQICHDISKICRISMP